MSDTRNGGPAFPSGEAYSANGVISRKGPLYEGMTLHDYFAAKAMQGFLSGAYRDIATMNYKELVWESYLLADKMLAERAKGMKDDR